MNPNDWINSDWYKKWESLMKNNPDCSKRCGWWYYNNTIKEYLYIENKNLN